MPNIPDSLVLVHHAFGGLKDKAGVPMAEHCIRVWQRLLSQPTETQHIALLHDIVEDTHVDLPYLHECGYSFEVREAVHLLTHNRKEMDYPEYIERLCQSGCLPAIRVKIADQEDNRDPKRWLHLNRYQQKALLKKWEGVPEKLHEALNAYKETC
jgi:hypothetical protein